MKTARKLEHADRAATEAVVGAREHPLMRAVGFASELGDQPPLRALSLATIAAGAVRRDPRLLRTGVRMLAAHGLATWLKTRIKRRVDRTRPDFALDRGYAMKRGGSHAHELSSFPSGHTAGAVAVAQALARDYPEHATAALGVAAAISTVQVPRAKHFLGDVVAGALIGFVAERLTTAVFDALATKPGEAPPPHAPFDVAMPLSRPGAARRRS